MTDSGNKSGIRVIDVTWREMRGAMLVIVLVSLVIRLLYLRESIESPYFAAPFLDELYHFQWASNVSEGHLIQERVFFRAPLYSYLLGLKFFLIGADFTSTKLIQHIVGVITAALIALATFFLFGGRIRRDEISEIEDETSHGADGFFRSSMGVTALIAGLLYGFYAPAVFFEGELLDIFLSCFFYALLMVLVFRFGESEHEIRSVFIIGIVAGFAAITRPNILIMLPFLLLYIIYIHVRTCGSRTAAGALVVFGVALILPIIPVTLHNAVVGKCFVPISTYDGINFYIGNNLKADGYTAKTTRQYPFAGEYRDSVELFAEREAALLMGYEPPASEVHRYWLRRAWREIALNPARFISLLGKKCALFWNAYEIKNNKSIYIVEEFSPVLRALHFVFTYGLIIPLGVCGMVFSVVREGRRRAELLLLASMILTFSVSVILFFVSGRHRLPEIVLIIPFAAYGIQHLLRGIKQREWISIGIFIVLFGLIWGVCNQDWYHIKRDYNPARDLWSVANCLSRKGRHEESIGYYKKALEHEPYLADAYTNMGEAYMSLGEIEEAGHAFARSIEVDASDVKGYNNLAVYYERIGEAEKAEELYRRAIALEPSYAYAHKNLAELLAERGDEAGARYHRAWASRSGYK